MLANGVQIESHYSDMYVPVNDLTTRLLRHYKCRSNVTTFTNRVEGGLWFDIPFAYDPFFTGEGVL
jgi:hypothetical protein